MQMEIDVYVDVDIILESFLTRFCQIDSRILLEPSNVTKNQS